MSIRSRCWLSYGDSKGCSLQCVRDHASCSHVRTKCNTGELCWGRTFIHFAKRKHQQVSHFSIMRYCSLTLNFLYNLSFFMLMFILISDVESQAYFYIHRHTSWIFQLKYFKIILSTWHIIKAYLHLSNAAYYLDFNMFICRKLMPCQHTRTNVQFAAI